MSALHDLGGQQSKRLGKYRLLVGLGRGGMATVHLAMHNGPAGFAKLVVIKQVHAHHADDPEMMGMFLDEGRLAARLQHHNVVQTYEIGEDAGRHFMVMEYLDGQPLSRILQRLGMQMPLSMHLRVIADLLAGLHHAHELTDYDGTPLQVVHRDVNPQNVFVTYDGVVKVVDFGIAKAQSAQVHTAAGIVKGKVSYMAPEQICGHDLDRRADIFAVGVMLWEAVTGVRPWKGVADLTVLKTVVDGKFPSVRDYQPEVPEVLEAIIAKALARDPEDRYATAAELQADLEAFLETREDRATQRDIAALISSLFEVERTELRAVIEEQIRAVEGSPSSRKPAPASRAVQTASRGVQTASRLLQTIDHPPTPTLPSEGTLERSRVTVPSSPWARRGAPGSGSHETFAVHVSPPPSQPVPARSAGLWRAATVVLGVTLAVGLGASWQRFLAPRPAAPAAAAAAPAASAPAVPSVELRLTASPAEARLFVDDKPLEGNPWRGQVPRDLAGHRVRAEAKGFVSQTEIFMFDKDRIIDIALAPAPEASSDPVEAAAAAPAPVATVKKSDWSKRRRLDDKNPYERGDD